jgi:putative ABC transport system permease protein
MAEPGGALVRAATTLTRVLLRLYPSSFRRDVGNALVDDVRRRAGELAGARMGVGAGLWLVRLTISLVFNALAAWVGKLPLPSASWLDVKLAARMLIRQPGLTLVATFALAIGIPVGLLPLHVLDSLSRPLPVKDGEKIVMIQNYDKAKSSPVTRSLHDFTRWREELSSFADLAMWRPDLYNVHAADGRAAPMRGSEVTASLFSLLRIPPQLGRPLNAADEAAGAPDVVVIGHQLWLSRMAGAPDVVGKTIRIGGVPHTVVGVMPEGFLFPIRDHLWLPLRVNPLDYTPGAGPTGRIMGRLADGVSLEQARREIEFLGQRMASQSPQTHAQLQPQVLPYTSVLTEVDSPEAKLGILFTQTLAILMLVLACANVGILILARAATRSAELAIRTALGASRARIVSQLFIESLLLAVLAAGFGLLMLQAAARGPDELLAGLPFWVDFDVSLRTTAFAMSLAIVSAVLAGVLPALKATSKGVHSSIQRAAGGNSGIRFGRGYSALIVSEVAIGVWFLTIGWTLLPSAVSKPGGLGIQTDEYLSAALRIPRVDRSTGEETSNRPEFVRRVAVAHGELVRRLSAEPGVGPVAIASALPGMSSHASRYVQIEGQPRPAGSPAPAHLISVARVDIRYFDALQQPIVNGRRFNAGDLGDDRSAVIVNTGFVNRVLGGRNPLGQRLRYWEPGKEPGPFSLEIVGVVGPLGMSASNPNADQGLYHPVAPGELHPVSFAIRVGSDPERFTPRLRSIVAAIDPTALIQSPSALDKVPNPEQRILVWSTYLIALLAGIAVLLSAACLYALMSFTVAERTREIGIRTALGAQPSRIVSEIARRAFLQLSAGVLAGGGLSAVMLWGFDGRYANAGILRTANWPVTVAVIALAVMVVGMLACVKPTLRAIRIRPMEALRS